MPEPDSSTLVRAFVALPLPPGLVDGMRGLQQQLRERLGAAPVRWTAPEQIHLTLRFFGNIGGDEIEPVRQRLRQAAAGSTPFHLVARKIGCFPSFQKPSVIWVGLEGEVEKLLELQRRVEHQTQPFGTQPETRAFHPHLTLGRTRVWGPEGRRLGEVLRSLPAEEIGQWQVTALELVQSKLTPTGSVYSRLAEVPLGEQILS